MIRQGSSIWRALLIARGVTVVAMLLVGVVTLLIPLGLAVSDRQIAAEQVTTVGEVVEATRTETFVHFPDSSGALVNPDRGVLYPGGLVEGQRVELEYRASKPEQVRIAGRSWTLSIIPALSLLLAWIPLGLCLFVLHRMVRRAVPPRSLE